MRILETHRLYLRPFEDNDAEAIYSYHSLDEVARFHYREPYILSEVKTFIYKYADFNLSKRDEWICLAIINKTNQLLMGDFHRKYKI